MLNRASSSTHLRELPRGLAAPCVLAVLLLMLLVSTPAHGEKITYHTLYFYSLVSDPASICKNMFNGTLAMPITAEQNAFLWSTAQSTITKSGVPYSGSMALGGYRLNSCSNSHGVPILTNNCTYWLWTEGKHANVNVAPNLINGTPFFIGNYANGTNITFTNWTTGQPVSTGVRVYMASGGGWNARPMIPPLQRLIACEVRTQEPTEMAAGKIIMIAVNGGLLVMVAAVLIAMVCVHQRNPMNSLSPYEKLSANGNNSNNNNNMRGGRPSLIQGCGNVTPNKGNVVNGTYVRPNGSMVGGTGAAGMQRNMSSVGRDAEGMMQRSGSMASMRRTPSILRTESHNTSCADSLRSGSGLTNNNKTQQNESMRRRRSNAF